MRIPSTVAKNLRGVDVSHYQSNIDWDACFKGSGPGTSDNIVTVAVKAMEGELLAPDDHWERNWKGARDAGFRYRDAYLFHRPSADPLKSADLFSNLIVKAGGLFTGDSVSFDFECADAPHTSILGNAISCIWQIEKNLGVRMIRYSAAYFMDLLVPDDSPFCNGPLWVANYGVSDPKIPRAYASLTRKSQRGALGLPLYDFWQYGADGYGAIAGVPVGDHVDHDVFRSSSLEDLATFHHSLRILPVETVPRAPGEDPAPITSSALASGRESR